MFKIEPLAVKHRVRIDEKTHLRVNFRPVDQFPAQPFNRGVNGFPANDITLLSRATNAKEYEQIIARLDEVKVSNPDNTELSDVEILEQMIPSWVNTPYLLQRFADYYNSTHTKPLSEPVEVEKPVEKPIDQQIIESV